MLSPCARASLLLLVPLLWQCSGNPDPCEGYDGTCLAVELDADSGRMADQLRVVATVNGTLSLEQVATPPAGQMNTGFPLFFAVHLGSIAGNVSLDVTALLQGQRVLHGVTTTQLSAAEHRRIVVPMTAVEDQGADLAPPADISAPPDLAPVFPRSMALSGSTTDYLEIPAAAALNLSKAFTLEAWVRRSSFNRCEAIMGKDYRTSYRLGFCTAKLRLYTGQGMSQDGLADVPASQWTHVAAVWIDGGEQRFYINGMLDSTQKAGPPPAANNNPLVLGADADPSGDPAQRFPLQGSLAEVRLWSRALTPDEIQARMNLRVDPQQVSGLVAAWHLTDDYTDSAGGNNGLMRGSVPLTGPAVMKGN